MDELNRYRDLLSTDGESLVDIVCKALHDIGITTNKTELGAHVDLVRSNIAVEVYGTTDKIDLSNKKLNQLLIYSQSSDGKLVLIANTYKRESPSIRKEKNKIHFTPQALQVLKSLKICAMTTQKLYEMWRESKLNPKKIEDIKKSISEAEGELRSWKQVTLIRDIEWKTITIVSTTIAALMCLMAIRPELSIPIGVSSSIIIIFGLTITIRHRRPFLNHMMIIARIEKLLGLHAVFPDLPSKRLLPKEFLIPATLTYDDYMRQYKWRIGSTFFYIVFFYIILFLTVIVLSTVLYRKAFPFG